MNPSDTSFPYQCTTCKKEFPSLEWLKTHRRIYLKDGPHEDKAKDSLVEWLETHTGIWNKKEDCKNSNKKSLNKLFLLKVILKALLLKTPFFPLNDFPA